MESLNFNQKCYELVNQIPKGKITTYSEIAKALNSNAWRAVGNAMAKNSYLITIPCHRVIRSDGSVGNYALGSDKKVSLLQQEGVRVVNGKIANIEKYLFKFSQ